MKNVLSLAAASAWNRRGTLALTVLAVALSVALLLGIERLREDAREGFTQSVSGTDLVVGARSAPVQLVLYAVFRIGGAINNISWKSAQTIAADPAVAWSIPLSLGDSHKEFPVLGTTTAYFERFRFGARHALELREGRPFADTLDGLFEAVLGAEVADRLGYRVGHGIVLAHGAGEVSLAEHADKPFSVVGILARTGTPVDRTVHVSLSAIEAIHLDWAGGAPLPGAAIPAEFARKFDLTPKTITALLLGLKSRAAVFQVQRRIDAYPGEPLMAVLPGVALDELWEVVGIAERALLLVSTLVVAVGLAGMTAVVLAGLNERRRELAVLRSVGAHPHDVFMLLALEGVMVTLVGILLGVVLLAALAAGLAPWLETSYGVVIRPLAFSATQCQLLAAALATGSTAALLPGWRAYRLSLADGLVPRI
jgi:putative ABC transport system permease protein